jgi:HlyD family secretion protein
VLRLLRKSETPVQLGTPLVELADIADLEVMAEVLTTDAVRIRPGDAVLITDWGGEGVLEGRVQRVEPGAFTKVSALGVDEQRTVVVVDLTSPPALWRRLGDGYRVTVGIVVAALQGATLVPAGALFRDGEGWALFALVEGRAEKRRVTLAGRGETEAAVTEGVAPGDTVIVFPGDAVAEGVRVRPR